MFALTAATVSAASASELHVTVPEDATTGLIQVKTASGILTTTQPFVLPLPPPSRPA